MLKYWHISFLVLIALIWKVRPASASMDVCDTAPGNVSMYCTCEPWQRNDLEITCYVFGPISENNEVWGSFRRHENTVAFTLQPRRPDQLEFIPIRTLQDLPSLVTLKIQEGNIAVVPSSAISDLPKLHKLDLVRNGIIVLERFAISNLPHLKKLTLSENSITHILSDTFSGLEALEELYLDRNNISNIEGCAFCDLHSLKELELWKNHIEHIDERTFRGLRYLQRLELFNNKLHVIEAHSFSSLPALRELDLKNNLIYHISQQAFHGLDKLIMLKLSNNRIKALPDHVFKPLPKLMQLDLSINQLEEIQVELIENTHNTMSNQFMFSFRNNPLACGCVLSWLPHWEQKAKSSRFGQELRHAKCLTSSGEEVLVIEQKLKPCEKTVNRRTKVAKLANEHTVSTLSSHAKEHMVHNPKYDSEYSDGVENRTQQAQLITVQPMEDPNFAISHYSSILLLCWSSFIAIALT